jgi:hypothetical protein
MRGCGSKNRLESGAWVRRKAERRLLCFHIWDFRGNDRRRRQGGTPGGGQDKARASEWGHGSGGGGRCSWGHLSGWWGTLSESFLEDLLYVRAHTCWFIKGPQRGYQPHKVKWSVFCLRVPQWACV